MTVESVRFESGVMYGRGHPLFQDFIGKLLTHDLVRFTVNDGEIEAVFKHVKEELDAAWRHGQK